MIFPFRRCRYHFPRFRFSLSVMPILAALLLAATPPPPEMRSEKLGEGRYRIILTAPGLTLAEGQRKAAEEATRLCRGPPVTLGHYRWNSHERIAGPARAPTTVTLTLEQDAVCAQAPPPPPVPQPTGWQPTDSDMAAVLDLTARYFAARDAGRYDEAWSLFTPGMQDISPLPKWQVGAAEFNRLAGGGIRRRPVAITWYDNPPNAQQAGIFAAVDFVGEAAKLEAVCGYLVWLRQPDGGWRLMREEEGRLERRLARGVKPEERARLRSAMGCRDPG
jgi:hypothetical protein